MQDWAAFARLIKAMPGRSLPPLLPPPPVVATMTPQAPARPPVALPRLLERSMALQVGNHPGGLDNASWNRFRSGKLVTMRTIDLHGRTAQRAYHALHAFLISAHADHVRCVEVITGRGSGETGGVIKRELPLWLNLPALRPLVLAATHPHPSNSGSVRLLLRRPK